MVGEDGPPLEASRRLDRSVVCFLKAREALIKEDIPEASRQADLSLELSSKAGSPFNTALRHLMKAQVLHRQGRDGEAKEHLRQTLEIAGRSGNDLLRFHAFMIRAQIELDRGNNKTGLRMLRQALGLGSKGGYLNTFLDCPRDTARLCVKALEWGIQVEYVKELVRLRKLVPDEPPSHLEAWPWRLKIWTLGRFRIQRDGDLAEISAKSSRRPLSLLKALIAMGGRGVPQTQLEDLLWPDAEGDMARQSFKTNLHRLRRLLGVPEAIRLEGGFLSLDPRLCWVDLLAFDQLISKAEATWGTGSKKEDLELSAKYAAQAMDLYRGAFLEGETQGEWVQPVRRRLGKRSVSTAQRLANYWEGKGNPAQASYWRQREAAFQVMGG